VTGPYAVAIIVVALSFAAYALIAAAANWRRGIALLVACAVLEVMLIGFFVGGITQMAQSSHHFAKAEFVVYLLALVAIPPAAVFWAWGEKSRSGTLVIALAFLITPIMVLRVQQVWAGPLG
jgi:hypothetical protein